MMNTMFLSRRTVIASSLAFVAAPAMAATPPGLAAYIASPRRSPANVKRDKYRHPAALLGFFGLTATQSVLEIEPGGGYWTEILAPYLKTKGHYTAALPSDPAAQAEVAYFLKKLGADPRDFSQVSTIPLSATQSLGDPASYDFVLSCRNLHNWLASGTAPAVLGEIFASLKVGGVFGIEDHRASTATPQDPKAKSGYVREDYAKKLILAAGFQYVASSEIGANPRDTKNYPDGVWDLPPSLHQRAVNKAKYLAIGESDRWTLKFVKP